jgi:hypothetical protein
MHRSSKQVVELDKDWSERLRRRWAWANCRRIAGVPSPFFSATAIFLSTPQRPKLFEGHPDVAALACVSETSALQLFLGASTTRHFHSKCRDSQGLDLYICARSVQSSNWFGVAVLGKSPFEPLRLSTLLLAKSLLRAEFPGLDHLLLLAQMMSPTRLSLIEVADVEANVSVSEERQFVLVDPDQATRPA